MAANERDAVLQKHARDINMLSDPDRFKRKRALDTLTQSLLEGKSVSPGIAH